MKADIDAIRKALNDRARAYAVPISDDELDDSERGNAIADAEEHIELHAATWLASLLADVEALKADLDAAERERDEAKRKCEYLSRVCDAVTGLKNERTEKLEQAEAALAQARREEQVVKLGVIEFHPKDALRERFYAVVDDLRAAGAIVDLWLMDIATVLREHGYAMTVRRKEARPDAGEGK